MRKMQMVIRNGKSSRSFIKIMALFVCIFIVISGVFINSYCESVNADLAENLIRLHVIANSDSEEDQAIKLRVRDEILKYTGQALGNSRDIAASRTFVSENLESIRKVAENEIKKCGKEYCVKTYLGMYPFPTKKYGDVTLPAGNYEALRVVIGNGEGKNWWCVLFPPLCFVDATHGEVPESVKQDLKNVLTEDEYSILTSDSNDKDIQIKMKFKVVEIFENSKIKLNVMLDNIKEKNVKVIKAN